MNDNSIITFIKLITLTSEADLPRFDGVVLSPFHDGRNS